MEELKNIVELNDEKLKNVTGGAEDHNVMLKIAADDLTMKPEESEINQGHGPAIELR